MEQLKWQIALVCNSHPRTVSNYSCHVKLFFIYADMGIFASPKHLFWSDGEEEFGTICQSVSPITMYCNSKLWLS